MIKKIFLASLLSIIFSCAQCFAAQNSDSPLCEKNPATFIAAFNQSANNNGGNFIFGAPQLLPNEGKDDNHVYEVGVIPEGLKVLTYFLTNKDDNLNRILIMADNSENLGSAFKPMLLALGLTEKEITADAVFDATETTNSFWCAATKRYINVTTAVNKQENMDIFYMIVLASQEKPAK